MLLTMPAVLLPAAFFLLLLRTCRCDARAALREMGSAPPAAAGSGFMPAGSQRIGRSTSTSRRGVRARCTPELAATTDLRQPRRGLPAGGEVCRTPGPGSVDAGGDTALLS